MSKKIYYVRLNCIGFNDFAVEAKSKEDAINYARNHFQCDGTESEFCETLDESESLHREIESVFYPEEPTHE